MTTGGRRTFTGGCLAAFAAVALTGAAHAQMLAAAPSVGQDDSGWFRYLNARFGLRVDLPESGFRQELLPNGFGMTLISLDRSVTIEVHANRLESILPAATGGPERSIAALHDEAMAATRQKGGRVTYSVRRNDFYVISGTLGPAVYYERVAISPACPDVFNAIRVTYPQAIEHALDGLVTRVSLSLRATCPSRIE